MRVRNYNFYEVLGVERTCSNEEIRSAYLKLAKQYHPDINKDPGSDDKFKMITVAYEALSNQRNRDLYDAYMFNDPYTQEWKYQDEPFRDSEHDSAKNFYRERARYDRNSQNFYKHQTDSNFWQGGRDDFESEFTKDFENIFTRGSAGFKRSKPQKSDDLLLEIVISIVESFNGVEKKVKFSRIEKCKSCHGYRSAPGYRPSKCFTCNGAGEIRTSMFNSKKCSQCRGIGYIIKHPCKECDAQGVKNYDCEEVIPIPKGIRDGTNIRLENKANGDLVIKVVVENTIPNLERLADDVLYTINLSLVEAIFGCKKEFVTLENKKETVEVKPGLQFDEKIVFKNKGFYNTDNKSSRGNLIVKFKIAIPSCDKFSDSQKVELKKILHKIY